MALGNAKMLADLGLEAPTADADARRDQGETVMFVVVDGAVAGLVSVADPVKETTPQALKALHLRLTLEGQRPRETTLRPAAATRDINLLSDLLYRLVDPRAK